MVKTRTLVTLLVVVVAIAAGVSALQHRGGSAPPAKDKGKKGASGPVSVSVSTVSKATVPVRLRAIGNIEPSSTVSLKARVDGQIVEVKFQEGQEVKKGDVLFRIDPRPFEAALRQAEANALRDAAARDQARSQERRYQELLEKNFVSKEAYAQIRTNADTTEASAKASQAALENARLNLEYCTIRSPLDGFVGKVLLQVGNLVKANDTAALVVINQVRPVYASFAVPEQELSAIRKHMGDGPLAVEVFASKSDARLSEGRLVFIDNAVDSTTGTIKLRARFDNADIALWPGQFVNVSLRLFDEADAVVLPTRALQTGPMGQFVYVVSEGLSAEVRRVVISRAEGELSVVASGVKPGEQVVIRGALRLSAGAKVALQAEGGKAGEGKPAGGKSAEGGKPAAGKAEAGKS